MSKNANSGHAIGGGGLTVGPGALAQLSGTDWGGNIYYGITINGAST